MVLLHHLVDPSWTNCLLGSASYVIIRSAWPSQLAAWSPHDASLRNSSLGFTPSFAWPHFATLRLGSRRHSSLGFASPLFSGFRVLIFGPGSSHLFAWRPKPFGRLPKVASPTLFWAQHPHHLDNWTLGWCWLVWWIIHKYLSNG